MNKLLFVLAVSLIFSCTDEDGAQSALEDLGMTNIEFHGHDAFSCGKDDFSCTEFTAVNPNGRSVKGAVGCGVGCGKGCTVRFK